MCGGNGPQLVCSRLGSSSEGVRDTGVLLRLKCLVNFLTYLFRLTKRLNSSIFSEGQKASPLLRSLNSDSCNLYLDKLNILTIYFCSFFGSGAFFIFDTSSFFLSSSPSSLVYFLFCPTGKNCVIFVRFEFSFIQYDKSG